MTDRVLFQTDDALSESNLGRALDRSNARDYVERGFDAIANWADGEVTVGTGVAFVHDSGTDRTLVVDADERTVSLADAGGDNWVHLVVDDSAQDAVRLEVRADSSDPAGPSLLLLEADAAAETLTDRNRLPKVQAREPTDAEDVARKAETDALDAVKVDLPVTTGDLSDDAVTAAKIAATAVESDQIADGAVGVEELAAALGTSDGNPVPGTTHMESVSVSQSINGADIANAAEAETLKKTASGTGLEFSPIEAGVDYQLDTFTASGTWDKPVGIQWVIVDVISAGGGGASGNPGQEPGTGGGGGGRVVNRMPAQDLPSSLSITVGAGGSGGTNQGDAGSGGGDSSFGDLIDVPGGAGGENGGFVPGGRGGGWNPQEDSDNDVIFDQTGFAGAGVDENTAGAAEWGGGGGAANDDGGNSWRGGGGGGVGQEPGFSESRGGGTGVFGGNGGADNAGQNGSDGNLIYCGEGGGGGLIDGSVEPGGDGGFPAGGGGGGSAETSDSSGTWTEGGNGGDGVVRVWYW